MSENTNTEKAKHVGAIWVRTSKSGDKYLSLQVEINGQKYNYVGFKNDYKTEDKHPSYKLFEANQQPGQEKASPAPAPAKVAPKAKTVTNEDMI